MTNSTTLCQSTLFMTVRKDPVVSLKHGVFHGDPCMTVVHKGRPAAMFGAVPVTSSEFGWDWPVQCPHPDGLVWLLGTDDIPLFSSKFLRWSRHWLKDLSIRYKVLGNMVDERNSAHVRWIEWLGFTMMDTIDYGPQNLPFIRFYKEA